VGSPPGNNGDTLTTTETPLALKKREGVRIFCRVSPFLARRPEARATNPFGPF